MFSAIRQYAFQEVLPRIGRIVFTTHWVGSAVLGYATLRHAHQWTIATSRVMDLETLILAYAAIVFGASAAGMALVLTFPNDDFVQILMREKLPGQTDSAYSDLLFVFSWTAIMHWVLMVLGVGLILVRGSERQLLNEWDGTGYRLLVAALFSVTTYAVCQFLLTVITLAQVGRVYEQSKLRLSRKTTNRSDAIAK